jgi:hypothetical protein
MPQAANGWTVERAFALPNDGNRYEVVDGQLLVSPSPEFQHTPRALGTAEAVAARDRPSPHSPPDLEDFMSCARE